MNRRTTSQRVAQGHLVVLRTTTSSTVCRQFEQRVLTVRASSHRPWHRRNTTLDAGCLSGSSIIVHGLDTVLVIVHGK